MKEIRALTSLRGVAAMWVFLFHLDLKRPMFPPGLLTWVPIGRGYIAVDLFFVLSGFVMMLGGLFVMMGGLAMMFSAFVSCRHIHVLREVVTL